MNPSKMQDAEVAAFHIAVSALIATHHDKKALLAAFNSLAATIQTNGIATGKASSTPPELRIALERLRDLMAQDD